MHIIYNFLTLETLVACNSVFTHLFVYSAGAQKISDESHYMTMDKIFRRDRLEYVECRVLVGHEKEDNFGLDDEE